MHQPSRAFDNELAKSNIKLMAASLKLFPQRGADMNLKASYSGLENPFLVGLFDRLRVDAWFYVVVVSYTVIGLIYLSAFGQLAQTAHMKYVEPGQIGRAHV